MGDGVLRDTGPIDLPEPTIGLAAAAVATSGVAVNGCGLWVVSEGVDSVWLAPWTPAAYDEVEEQTCPSGDGRS